MEKVVDEVKTLVEETLEDGKCVNSEGGRKDKTNNKKRTNKSSKKTNNVKLYYWISVLLLIAVQVVLLKWWAILIGIITIIIARLIVFLISNRKDIKEDIKDWIGENKISLFIYAIAIIAIVVESFTIGWWTTLAGPATLLVAYLLNKLINNTEDFLDSL